MIFFCQNFKEHRLGKPVPVSPDQPKCPECGREINWQVTFGVYPIDYFVKVL